ncbi:hypothetical protein BO068_005203, partial [Escherichia coli]|nr:hypothetical protein [Escherichia coli]
MTGEAERPGPTYRKSALLALGAWIIACLAGGMRLVAPDSSLFYWAALVAFMGITPLMYGA